MPVPQTFTSGLAGLLTMYSANARQVFSAPSPAPEPRTGCPSTRLRMLKDWLPFNIRNLVDVQLVLGLAAQ